MSDGSGVNAARLAPGYDLSTGMDAKAEALAHIEAAALAIATVESRLRSNKHLRRALDTWSRGDAAKTAKHALAATEADDANAKAYHVLAIALEKLGFVHKALVTYERAFSLDPDDTDLLLNLGLTAWKLGHLDGAERMFRHYIEKHPDLPAGYNNLGSVLRDRGNLEIAIDTLRAAIYRMPQEPMLWNTLATTLAEDGRAEESLVFYEEALRLKPDYARVWHNLGYSYSHLGRLDDALYAYDHALNLARLPAEKMEARHSRSICLLGLGKLEEGFKDYEIRQSPDFRASVIHYTKAPCWNGEPLAGKRILLVGEQGLGDELMFANAVPDVARAVGPDGKLQIAVDPRLIPLFQRSFPQAEVGDYDDRKLEHKYVRIFEWARKDGEPDFYAPFGTPLQFYRRRAGDFPKQPFLVPDAARKDAFRARLAELGPGPYVGICWRSMVLSAMRSKYYSAIDAWAPILKTPGVTFVNLQYGNCSDELARAAERTGVTIHNFADLNLKSDIDGAAALSAACDLVISAPTAAAALAGAIGTPVWFMVAGRVWPQLGTDEYPWYGHTKVFMPENFADWNTVIPRTAEALSQFAADAARREKC
jgi:tetratricopeptide (TPR) repeat protein